MDVIFAKPILDRLREAIDDARSLNRVIDRIVLDEDEWKSLEGEWKYLDPRVALMTLDGDVEFNGVRIVRALHEDSSLDIKPDCKCDPALSETVFGAAGVVEDK